MGIGFYKILIKIDWILWASDKCCAEEIFCHSVLLTTCLICPAWHFYSMYTRTVAVCFIGFLSVFKCYVNCHHLLNLSYSEIM